MNGSRARPLTQRTEVRQRDADAAIEATLGSIRASGVLVATRVDRRKPFDGAGAPRDAARARLPVASPAAIVDGGRVQVVAQRRQALPR